MLVGDIQHRLRSLGAQTTKIHGSAHQPKMVDIIACYHGVYMAIEAKIWPNKPTPGQCDFLRQTYRAGGVAVLAYDMTPVERAIERIDRTARKDTNHAHKVRRAHTRPD